MPEGVRRARDGYARGDVTLEELAREIREFAERDLACRMRRAEMRYMTSYIEWATLRRVEASSADDRPDVAMAPSVGAAAPERVRLVLHEGCGA